MSDRELLTECLDVLTHDAAQRTFAGGVRMSQLAIKLRAHLAAPRPEPVFDGQSGHPVMLPRAPEPVLGLISDEVRAALKAADAVESQEAYRTRTPAAAPRPEPVAWMYVNSEGECEQIEYGTEAIDDDSITLLYAAPPTAAPEPTHPGYVIGSHWLETAYSRICAGEAEANVLRDYGLIREEAFTIGVEHLRQENERLRQINWSHEMKLSVRGYEMQIDSLKADNERLRGLLAEAQKAVWMNYDGDLLDRIEAALREVPR